MIPDKLEFWISASVIKFFKNLEGTHGKIFIPGEKLDTESLTTWSELKITGPQTNEVLQNQFMADVSLDIIISEKQGLNIYSLNKVSGKFQNQMSRNIEIYKIAESVESLLGCLRLIDKVRVVSYGPIDASRNQAQTLVSADYELSFSL